MNTENLYTNIISIEKYSLIRAERAEEEDVKYKTKL